MASETDSKLAPKRRRAPRAKPGVSAAKRPRTPRRADGLPAIASPAAAGPAGALLEGHVGAQYLLPLLSGGEARGLPGVVVTRVAFQRAGLDHPMDDVVVTGHDRQGHPATLELQAKRTITFSASDRVFADVVALACRAVEKPDFDSTRYELAVAIARTSTTIEQYVQETLRWAREYQDPTSFFARLNQPGAAHQAMRDFVAAFRGHMATAGARREDADVWRLLSRFQVLAFDFEQPGSVCAQLARERCAMQLAPQDVGRAGELWDALQQIALETDAKGGDLDAAALRERLTSERGYRLAGDRRLHGARERLAEIADAALADIKTNVGTVALDRTAHVSAALATLDQGRYLEIRGAGGVGKSGVLKVLAQLVRAESRIVVVAPNRIPGGGWAALKAQLGCEANARELLTDLAGDGGGTLFIDGIDRFDNPAEQQTVVDLLRAAAQVREFRVVATARLDFDADAREWLPPQELGEAPPLLIPELSEDEKAQLRRADPALAALLAPGHPAEALVSNLYRLDRLARGVQADAAAPFSEAQMAWQWWTTGDSAQGGTGRVERRRLLQLLAAHSLGSSDPLDARAAASQAIAELTHSGSLRDVGAVRVKLAHDVLRDWAIGCLLYEEPERVNELTLTSRAPMRLVRGVELAARLHAECDNGMPGWQALLGRVSGGEAHGSWKRAVLLALVRSERANEALERCLPALSGNDAALFGDLVRATIAVDSQPAAPLWAAAGLDKIKLPEDLVVPRGPAWLNLIVWSLALGDRVPHGAVPALVDLYHRWCTVSLGQDATLSPLLVARLYQWLVAVEARNHPAARDFQARMAAQEAPGLSMTAAQEGDLRMAFLMWCRLRPDEAAAYLQGWQAHPHRRVVFRHLLTFVGSAPQAAPRAVADLFLAALPEGDNERDHGEFREPFSHWNVEYFPASPARAPFLSLLQADKAEGLRLVHGIVARAIQYRTRVRTAGDNRIEIPFPTGRRSFPLRQSYWWPRANVDSHVVTSALMALEAWAHLRIEAGDEVQAVIDDVLGPDGSPAAYLLVAVDVMLSHWPRTREVLWPFLASAELLALDRQRASRDALGDYGLDAWVRPEPAGPVKLGDLRRRRSRGCSLDEVLVSYGHYGPDETRESMRQALREEAARLGPPDGESNPTDSRFAAMSALNRLDPANFAQADDEAGPTIVYQPPEQEAQRRADLQAKADRGLAEMLIRGRITRALTEPPCAAGLLEEGVHWAMREAYEPAEGGGDDQAWIERTRLMVAALVFRDGSPELKAEHGGWAQSMLTEATKREADDRGIVQQLPYNPPAITAMGLLAEYRDDAQPATLERLLHVVARHDTGMATVLRAELAAQRSLPPELARSLVRLGLVSAIYAVPNHDDLDGVPIEDWRAHREQEEAARKDAERSRLQGAVAAELRWLAGGGAEPGWPDLPDPRPPKELAAISLGEPRPLRERQPEPPRDYGLDSAAAARWLPLASDLWRKDHPELLRALVRHGWPWTAGANGVGCEPDEEAGERAFEWNRAYFAAATVAGATLGEAGLREYVLEPVSQLPEERFFDATEATLHELDQLWLNDGLVSDGTVLMVREALAPRIKESWPWLRLASERSASVEIHLAGALAAMFLSQHEIGNGPRCYVRPPGAARTEALLPMLSQLATEAAGSAFVASAILGLLEVDPQAQRLPFMANVVAAWWQAQGADAEFWIDYGIGKRVCAWIETAVLNGSVSQVVLESPELATTVDILVQSGTTAAPALDERISTRREKDR